MGALPNVVVVHGAWADGSSWGAAIEQLQADGYRVSAPQFALTRLADDVARLRQLLARQHRPTLLVGHSYGGQVTTALGADAPNAVGLAYVAAFGLEEGESIGALLDQAPGGSGPGAPGRRPQGLAWMPEDDFVNHFAADVDPAKARVMFAVQQPLHWGALGRWWACRPGGRCRAGSWSPTATRWSRPLPSASSPLAWAPPPWRSRPTTWPWSPTQARCCGSSRRPPRRCRPQPEPDEC